MGLDKKDEILMERFQLISPLLCREIDGPEYLRTRAQIADRSGLSEKTISRYVAEYQKHGVDGLRPKNVGRPGSRAISEQILSEAIMLRRENPMRSVSKIIRTLEIENKVETGSIKRSTMQDQLAKSGFSKEEIKVYTDAPTSGGYRFERMSKNDLWQVLSRPCNYP
jgi:transposase